jgi:hypothetical protein
MIEGQQWQQFASNQAKLGKARQGKARQGKARQGKARQEGITTLIELHENNRNKHACE